MGFGQLSSGVQRLCSDLQIGLIACSGAIATTMGIIQFAKMMKGDPQEEAQAKKKLGMIVFAFIGCLVVATLIPVIGSYF